MPDKKNGDKTKETEVKDLGGPESGELEGEQLGKVSGGVGISCGPSRKADCGTFGTVDPAKKRTLIAS